MTKILIISDTHGDKNNIINLIELEKPNYVIHAGDFCVSVTFISKYVDYFVGGNNDVDGEKIKLFDIEEIKFFLTHGHQYFFIGRNKGIINDAKLYGARVAITGHTHIEEIIEKDGILLINPGSLSFPRNKTNEKTYVVLIIDKNNIISSEIKKWKK